MNLFSLLALGAFLATVPLSNWALAHIGICSGAGPCVIPVYPGLMAPSGVIFIGIALVLRDHIHRTLGPVWALGAILAGGIISLAIAPPALAVAAVLAFVLSETIDLAVYDRMHKALPALAVLLSGVAGALTDSMLFLWLAFGDLTFLMGQSVGKVWASLAAAIVVRLVIVLRNRGVTA